jgi:hypothetical protein
VSQTPGTATKATDQTLRGAAERVGSKLRSPNPLVTTLLGCIAVGVLAVVMYSWPLKDGARIFAIAELFAAAALAVGSLLGLLFGVPRSIGSDAGVSGGSTGAIGVTGVLPTVGANTNLEQISDWLTKVLVGASLVEFKSIGKGAADLFAAIGPVLDKDSGTAFAGGLIVYHSVIGFFAGWLYARLRLGAAMSQADALLGYARRAEAAGDTDSAASAKEAANRTIQAVTPSGTTLQPDPTGLTGLVSQYEQLRATEPWGTRRTGAMEDLVRQARRVTHNEAFSAQDLRNLIQSGSDGQRVMALGVMEGDTRLADAETIVSVIEAPRSAFEQYHGLYLANLLVASMPKDQQTRLLGVLNSPGVIAYIGADTSRSSLRDQILRQLSTSGASPPPAQPPAQGNL